ncbi:hypothetical protein N7540_003645 [Penicillium herquei]|nr:hypothetical protein N7540_003645 [Penicillium herquei]
MASSSNQVTSSKQAPPEVFHALSSLGARGIAGDEPPMSTLKEIFAHLAKRAMSLGLGRVLERLERFPLRTATVCSGTESPLIALQMIMQGLGPIDGPLFRMVHAFSCEIVAFKQALIERNFGPTHLFRDLRDLGGDVAQTAYGSLDLIPGDLDILIAGTACVDYSMLNTSRPEKGKGESASTFNGLLAYAEKYRPRLVICENVRGAPWDDFVDSWNEIDYSATYQLVDTKLYYLPHTRERGYLIAIDNRRMKNLGFDIPTVDSILSKAKELIIEFQRPCSSPTSQFLLGEDDRQLERVERDLLTRIQSLTDHGEPNWLRYQVRHQELRNRMHTGDQRPISRSQPGGASCTAPDFYKHTWFKKQVERIWETLDIKYLMGILKDYDFHYKEQYIDLSQGVDRGSEGIFSFGVTGCLTPCGIPFSTIRGGPLSGIEALLLQGLAGENIILSHESSRQLQDLAGNAMSSTVVGAVMLAALIACSEILEDRTEYGLSGARDGLKKKNEILPPPLCKIKTGHSLVDATVINVESKHRSPDDEDLPASELGCSKERWSALEAQSVLAARYCYCEKQTQQKLKILKCTDCGHTACEACSGNPPHAYKSMVLNEDRIQPLQFMKTLKEEIPLRYQISGLSSKEFERFKEETVQVFDAFLCQFDIEPNKHDSDDDDSLTADESEVAWEKYISCIRNALSEVVRFTDIKRREIWTVYFDSKWASLHIEIDHDGHEFLLFAKAPEDTPSLSIMREIFAKPIARMRTKGSSSGIWEIMGPLSTGFDIEVNGSGHQVKAYGPESGITHEDREKDKLWTELNVFCKPSDPNLLDQDLNGVYEHLPNCGTAMGTLYKKKTSQGETPIFMFLDPRKYGFIDEDTYVFSVEHRRNTGHEVRKVIAEVECEWRARDMTNKAVTKKAFARRAHKVPGMTLPPS